MQIHLYISFKTRAAGPDALLTPIAIDLETGSGELLFISA